MKHLILALLLTSCATAHAWGPKPPQMNPSWPNEAWGNHAYKMAEKLPLTVDEYYWCPTGMKKQQNRAHLMAGIVKFESNFRPNLEYRENFKNRFGEWIISTGLFQISRDSVRGYGYNVTQQQLHDPLLNIEISSVILERWMKRDGVISGYDTTIQLEKPAMEYGPMDAEMASNPWRGGARYWSVLRRKQQHIKDYMASFCQ